MERLTKHPDNKMFYVTDQIAGNIEEGYYGDAVEKLANFENLYDHLISRHTVIPSELEMLRNAGKNKTVTFKELLTEKMIIDMLLTQMSRHGLK